MKFSLPVFKWNWSWGFGLFIALPAFVLALLGIRAVRAERIEQQQKLREQELQIARLADEGLKNQLVAIEAKLRQQNAPEEIDVHGIYAFSLEPNGLVKFPRHRVYFGEQAPPQWPAAVEDLIEQAQAAKAQRRNADALAAYRHISQVEPKLSDWAKIGIAAVEHDAGDGRAMSSWANGELANSDDTTPTGLPVPLHACAFLDPMDRQELSTFTSFVKAILEQLSRGKWWLSYDERRFYDDQLRRLLLRAGQSSADDPEPDRLAMIARIVREIPPAARESTGYFEATSRRLFGLLVKNRSQEHRTGRLCHLSRPICRGS